MEAICRFWIDGRYGNLSGIFVADVDKLEELVGEELYFGEVLGKHSEVIYTFHMESIEVITKDSEAISIFNRYQMETGYNPLDYSNIEKI